MLTAAELGDDGIPPGAIKSYFVEQKNPKSSTTGAQLPGRTGTTGVFDGRIGVCYEYPDGDCVVDFPGMKPMYLMNRASRNIFRCWEHK